MNAQNESLLENRRFQSLIDRQLNLENPNFHSSIRPYRFSDLKLIFKNSKHPIELLVSDSLVANGADYIKIIPQVNLNAGLNSRAASTEFNSDLMGGFNITANVKNKLSFGASTINGRQILSGWESIVRDSLGVFQGFGIAKGDDRDKYFINVDGYISYSPDHIFNLEIGKGKHFFGDGSNSLFLSNNASSYPYFKIETKVWNIKYVNLYSWQRNISEGPLNKNLWNNKFTATHYLSWNVSPQVNLGLFETIIWAGKDSLNNRGFELNYMNPIIFYRPIEFAQGSADNAIIGFSMKYIASNSFSFYGQWALDEFLLEQFFNNNGWWANKFGLQLGMNYFDAFYIDRLHLRSEFNLVRPFTYSHGNVTQNYAHLGQPLAHPLGSNFYNANLEMIYPKDDWYFQAHIKYSHFGRDSVGTNYGGNIFQSYVNPEFNFGNKIGQGIANDLLDIEFTASYLLSKKDDFRLFATLQYYHLNELQTSNDLYMRVGVKIYWPDH